jgi:hypothetical protein
MRHSFLGRRRPQLANSFLPGKWGWLGLLLVLSWFSPARAQGLLEDVNNVFNQRLETTCRYQEATLPTGVGRGKRYLQLGKRRYLIESWVANRQAVTIESYWLQVWGKDTLQLGKSRHELSTGTPYQQGQLRLGVFHEYPSPNPQTVEAGAVILAQEFSPAAILALRPDTARTGQTLYVLNSLADVQGDTLACYELMRSRTGDTCSVVLRERATQASRQWLHNTRVACIWEADRITRQVTATRFWKGELGSSHWVRTYATAALTNFTEMQYNSWPGSGHAQLNTRYTYRRQFRQLSAQQSCDTYTVLGKNGTAQPTFTITSTYQP